MKAIQVIESEVDPKRVLQQIHPPSVRTNDGYTFYRLANGKWVDSLDPARVDMTFDSGPDGMPVDDTGQPLDIYPPDPETVANLKRFLEEPGI